jgi:protein required for attachment to host cells
MLIPHDAFVLVADGQKFVLLRNVGDLRKPVLIFEGSGEKENPSTQLQGTDQPGRAFSYGSARSTMDQTDFHQLEEDRFASTIAQILQGLAEAGDFEKLIVVAPARSLAELRKGFGRELRKRIIAEIDKDLTKHPVNEITAILSRAD